MTSDAYCCPHCGYVERERAPGAVPARAACPRCSATASRLVTPPLFARMNPAVRARVVTPCDVPDLLRRAAVRVSA